MYEHLVPVLADRQRLSEYLVDIFPAIPTRKGIKKAIKKGLVSVDGVTGTTGKFIIGGEQITLSPAEKELGKPLDLPLIIHYEDEHLAVVEKPPGLLVSGNKWMTLTNALPANLSRGNLPDSLRQPQPAHRLDYPTSGLLLIGKTARSLTALGEMFHARAIKKTYLAVSIGLTPEKGEITRAIDQKEAVTHYVRLARVPSPRFSFLNLLSLQPATGRRHQLRLHLAAIDSPILGDSGYGKPGLVLQGKGLYLHAHQLDFKHPFTHKRLIISSPAPKKIRKLFPTYFT